MLNPDNKGWQRALTTGIFLAIGLLLSFFIGHRVELDTAILVAFSCGVAACWLMLFVSVKWRDG